MRIFAMLLCLALAVPALAATSNQELNTRKQVATLLNAKQLVVVEQAIASWADAVKGGDATVVEPGFDAYLDAAVWNMGITKTPKLASLLKEWSALRTASEPEGGAR